MASTLNRMFAAGGRQRQWSRSMSSSSRSSQISDASSSKPLLSEHCRYRCFNVGTCDFRRLFLSEHRRLRRCNDGYRGKCALGWSRNDGKREQRALAGLSVAARVSSLGSTIKGPAPCSFPSSSDAPVCASLVRAASAKKQSSHARPGH